MKDLTLEISPKYFIQLDTLILTPKRAILLEIKNYTGTVFFDETSGKTTIISPDGQSEKFDCVIHQLDRATNGVNRWLQQQQVNLPVEPILIMANQQTEISKMPTYVEPIFAKQLPRYIRNFPETPDVVSRQQIATIANELRRSQVNWRYKSGCEKYKIAPSTLKRGVLCLNCNAIMKRSRGRTWLCNRCKELSKGALEQAVADWYILLSNTLTNKQLRYFLELNSNSAASLIFRKLRLTRTGKPPNTIYRWDYKMPLNK